MTPRHPTSEDPVLQRHLALLRAQKLVILGALLVGALAAFGLSQLPERTYEAKAQLQFKDQSSDLTVLGIPAAPSLQPQKDVAAKAEVVTSQPVMAAVARDLKGRLSAGALRDATATSLDPVSDLVTVTVRTHDADLARAAANAVAAETIRLQTRDQRVRYARSARRLERRSRALGDSPTQQTQRSAYQDQVSRLLSLSTFARPVVLAGAAKTPDAPVSPKPVRNALLGAFVGLLLGVGLAFTRDALDRRMRTAEDIGERLGLAVVGSVGEDAMGLVAGISRSRDGVEGSTADLEPFRMLRTHLDFLGEGKARTVLVTSGIADEGKSTVASSLAVAAAAAGKRTLLVETDMRRPSLAARLGIAPTPGLSDYLLDQSGPMDVEQIVGAELHAPVNGSGPTPGTAVRLTCITAGSPTPVSAELLASERFRDFLDEVASTYDVVIIDSCPLLPVVDTQEILPRVDVAVVCVRVHRTTRDEAEALRGTLELLPDTHMGVVVTDVRRRDDGYYGGYGYGHAYTAEPAAV